MEWTSDAGANPDALALLERVVDNAPIALQVRTADGRSVLVNRRFRDLFGSSPPVDCDLPRDGVQRSDLAELVRRCFRGETIHVPPRWYQPVALRLASDSNEGRVWATLTLIPLKDCSGRVAHVSLCFHDVTDQLDRQEALETMVRESEARAAIVDEALDCVMVGCTSEEVHSGQVRWADITPPEWRQFDERALQQLADTGVAFPWEKEYVRKDGSRLPVLVGVAMLDAIKGECVAFILDQTDRKAAERAVERMREEREAGLEESIRARDDFLAVAGHELKTPLAALLMQLESLQRSSRTQLPARVGDRLDKAVGAGSRLRKLVDQLLDVSRLTAGGLRLEPERVDLSDVVSEIVTRITGATARRIGPVIVRSEPHVIGRWDRERIEQAIENLVENALKYGQGKPVEIDLARENGQVVLTVTDHGVGIDEDNQKRIFERFERAVSTRDFGGVGLGLWIARRVVEASGGRIDVHSVLGEGAAFTVRLPIDSGGTEDRDADA